MTLDHAKTWAVTALSQACWKIGRSFVPADWDGFVDELAKQLLAAVEEEAKKLAEEARRLKWRLNHQDEDDVEECRQGNHEGCGKE